MKTNLLLSLLVFLCLSCESGKVKSYRLVLSDQSLSFPLDANTKNQILYLMPYTDKEGKEYLTFQNQVENEILFYDMNTCRLEFKITPEIEGGNGVGRFLGYHIQNMDSIYVTNYFGAQEISLINKNAMLKDKINYEKADDGTPLSFFCFVTHSYKPATVIGRKMYIYSGPDRFVEKDPVAAVLDMDTKSIKALPFIYPDYPGSETKIKKYGHENDYSRCFDGERFIYSFYFDENIYVMPPAHDSVRSIKVKSGFMDKVNLADELKATIEDLCINSGYGNLLYDKYRDVYYRVAYPQTVMDKGVRAMELLEYGRRNFSIMLLDKDFNVIGETMFPDYTYNSKLMIMREDGLYISDSHYMNPDFSDDVLSFKKFDLVESDN